INFRQKEFNIRGKVIHGRKKGRELGFPTANILANPDLLEKGVYGVTLNYKEEIFFGLMNVGIKPTFNSLEKTIEVHILDFSGEIYGEFVECQPLFRIRGEQKFDSIEQLKHQIEEDIKFAQKRFNLKKDKRKTIH
ncbi:riboflavin kinase, partial [Neobacillus drentensis]|uniref:riboflavin kinase n=1 Tax=Neobacillus drentensis TaxID=220684 RepID=UPI002FFF90E5